MSNKVTTTVTVGGNTLSDLPVGQLVRLNGKTVRVYPKSETQAHVYPDWPGRNRSERRRAASEARRIKE